MKSCDENQNLMSTLQPFIKIFRVRRIAASKISIRKEKYLACLSMISLINHDLITK